jgi:MFS family permease
MISKYKQNVWKLYLIIFFHSLIPAYVIERLFWEERGMTIQLVVYTEIIYAMTVVILEIPTGIIADKWGRKRMIILDALFGCMEFIILIYANEFWHFAIVVILSGIGHSASSGSINALLFDSLKEFGNESQFEKILGRVNIFDYTAIIIASISGSLLSDRYNFEVNYWLSLIGMSISLIFSFLLVEPLLSKSLDENISIIKYIKISIKFFSEKKTLGLVLFFGMLTGAAINYIDEFWQIYIRDLGVSVIYFGVFSVLLMIIRFPGSILAYKVKKYLSYQTIIKLVLIIYSIGLIYIYVVRNYYSLIVILVLCLLSGIIEPIVTGYLHKQIDSTMRATIDSFQSLGLMLLIGIIGVGFGYISSNFDIFSGYGFSGLICFIYFVYYLFISNKEN